MILEGKNTQQTNAKAQIRPKQEAEADYMSMQTLIKKENFDSRVSESGGVCDAES